MKSKQIDMWNFKDMDITADFLFALSKFRLRSAEKALGEVTYELRNSFCGSCNTHADNGCDCYDSSGFDGYDDE